jgi:hypothetical protein
VILVVVVRIAWLRYSCCIEIQVPLLKQLKVI